MAEVGDFSQINLWPRQESNLDLELRKLLYYPLYDEAIICANLCQIIYDCFFISFLIAIRQLLQRQSAYVISMRCLSSSVKLMP